MWAKCAGRWAVCVWRCLHRAWGQCEDVRNWYMACLSQNLESFASSALWTQRLPKQLIRSVKSGGAPLNNYSAVGRGSSGLLFHGTPWSGFSMVKINYSRSVFLELFLENYSWGLPGHWNIYLRERPWFSSCTHVTLPEGSRGYVDRMAPSSDDHFLSSPAFPRTLGEHFRRERSTRSCLEAI